MKLVPVLKVAEAAVADVVFSKSENIFVNVLVS